MSCDVEFERMYTITVDGAISNTFPKSTDAGAGKKYNVTTNCTNGTGSWDATNWRMIENSNTNPTMKCNVNFTSAATWCTTYKADAGGGLDAYSGGGYRYGGECHSGYCRGSSVRIEVGVYRYYVSGCNGEYVNTNLNTAKAWCRSDCGL